MLSLVSLLITNHVACQQNEPNEIRGTMRFNVKQEKFSSKSYINMKSDLYVTSLIITEWGGLTMTEKDFGLSFEYFDSTL